MTLTVVTVVLLGGVNIFGGSGTDPGRRPGRARRGRHAERAAPRQRDRSRSRASPSGLLLILSVVIPTFAHQAKSAVDRVRGGRPPPVDSIPRGEASRRRTEEETALKLRSAGRLLALASVAVFAFAACSSTAGVDRAVGRAPSAAAPSVAPPRPPARVGRRRAAAHHRRLPAEGHRQPVLRRRQDRRRQGRRRARRHGHPGRAERGQGGPADPVHHRPHDPGVDAIIISADGKDEVAPALKDAMAAGHQGRRVRLEPGRRRLQRVRQPGRLQRRRRQPRRLGLRARPELHRRHRDPVGGRDGDQPERVDRPHEDDPATDAKYEGLKLVDTVYGDDDATKSTQQAQALLTKYPDLKVIVAPTTVGILAAAQVVKQAGKSDSVKVTGLGFPNDMKPFVADGTSPVFGLWSVPDLGYARRAGRREARQRRDHRRGGRDLHGRRSQWRQAVHDRRGRRRHPRAGLPVRLHERERLRLLGQPR